MDFASGLNKLQNTLTAELFQTTIWEFILNLLLAALLSFIIAQFYTKYGRSLSNRRSFAANFVLLAMTVTLIITVVRSSLALSLGLIGALSIIRFRAAIKEPEELAYLFFVMSTGLGLGANQRILTITAVTVILFLMHFKNKKDQQKEQFGQNLYLNIISQNPLQLSLEHIKQILEKYCPLFRLKRADQTNELLETTYLVEFKDKNSLQAIEKELRMADNSVRITFLDNKGGTIAIP